MSVKLAIGAKIYDISGFSDDQKDDLLQLSKSLNFRVNQVISIFGVYDQETALIMAALSLLEELKTSQELLKQDSKKENDEDVNLFTYNQKAESKLYTKNDLEDAMSKMANIFITKLKNAIEKKL